MAIIQLNYASQALAVQTNVTILLPEKETQFKQTNQEPYKVLYLLHGLTDDNLGWLRYTSIESIIRGTNLAIVMPNTDHGFYTDMKYGHPYFTYLTEELPTYLHNLFPFSTRKEDTFICGNSMGGYGALKCALTYPQRYAKVGALSPIFDIQRFVDTFELPGYNPIWTFGEDLKVKNTQHDLTYLLEKNIREQKELPAFYVFCGDEDILLQDSRDFEKLAKQYQLNYRYKEGKGEHLWIVWEHEIAPIIQWMLKDESK